MALLTVSVLAVFVMMSTYVQNASGQQQQFCAGIQPAAMNWDSFVGTCYVQMMEMPDDANGRKCIALETVADQNDPTLGDTFVTNGMEKFYLRWNQTETGLAEVIQDNREDVRYISSIIYNNSNGDYFIISCPGNTFVEDPYPNSAMLCTKSQNASQSAIDAILQEVQNIGFDTQFMKNVSQTNCRSDLHTVHGSEHESIFHKIFNSDLFKMLGPILMALFGEKLVSILTKVFGSIFG